MPTRPNGLRRYLRFWGPDVRGDVDDELQFHIEMRCAELVARGVPPEVARQQVSRRFGDAAMVRERCLEIGERRRRHARRAELGLAVRQDVRFTARMLRRQRLATTIIVGCLALGIGATTTVFSVANTMLLRPLPFPNGEQLVTVASRRGASRTGSVSSYPDFTDWRARQRVFSEMGAARQDNFVLGGDEPLRITGARASASLFRALGATPMRGRLFREDEDRPGAARVAIVSAGFAIRQLGGVDQAVGATLRLDDVPHTIVGILPDEHRFPESAEIWTPVALDPGQQGRAFRSYEVVASLKPGVTLPQARADMERITAQLSREYPEEDGHITVALTPLRERYIGAARPAFLLMSCAAVLVFMIACANVATLQLARATSRVREIAVRSALGASRARLVAQLLMESLLLSAAGGAVGVWLATLGSELLAKSVTDRLPPWMSFEADGRVLAFTLALSTLAGVLFGLAPALRLLRPESILALRDGGRGGLDLTRGRLYRGFVVAQVALSLMLLVGAAMSVRSVLRLQRVHPGFDAGGVLTFRVSLSGSRYEDEAARARFASQLLARLRVLPTVEGAGMSTRLPVAGCCSQFGLRIEGGPESEAQAMVTGALGTPGYLKVMRIPLVRGREFMESDDMNAPLIAVVSETFAARFWPTEEAIGKRFFMGRGTRTVVGIVKDVKASTLMDGPEAQFYVPYVQDAWPNQLWFVVRAPDEQLASLTPAIRAAVRAVDASLPVFSIAPMATRVSAASATQRLYGVLLGGIALVALALATAGVYGVVSYYVSRRTNEIGIRMALGATASGVRQLVLRQAALVMAAGVIAGLAGAVAAARALAHVLWGVRAGEVTPYVVASLALMLTAVVAALGPARRATAVDPMTALRAE